MEVKKEMSNYERMKHQVNQVVESQSTIRKGKVFYFPRREGVLNCMIYEINHLTEQFVNTQSRELFSLKDVSIFDNAEPAFFTFRGLNFSTQLQFDKSKKAFIEKKYDDDYMKSCRSSQWISRVNSLKKRISMKSILALLFWCASASIITSLICGTILAMT